MHSIVWFIFWEIEKVEEKGEYIIFPLSICFPLFNFACKKIFFHFIMKNKFEKATGDEE